MLLDHVALAELQQWREGKVGYGLERYHEKEVPARAQTWSHLANP
jgi:hypothetical protein